MTQSEWLSILSRADANAVKALAEAILPQLGAVTVLVNRVGLVMLPYTDSAHGTRFHLGEVLVSESHVRVQDAGEGYGMCVGRDLEQSMAVALLDAALQGKIASKQIEGFLAEQAEMLRRGDAELLCQVEATRIEFETF
jgi:alpha-D-ribose 1-methylphosphonate 5-triphosphate synthase subunit PhnG